jgi:hypothetical protein
MPPSGCKRCEQLFPRYPTCLPGMPHSRIFDRSTMTHQRQRFCARLLNLHKNDRPKYWGDESSGPDARTKLVSNSDQLLFWNWAIMMLETSTSSLSFRSSEPKSANLKFSSLSWRFPKG